MLSQLSPYDLPIINHPDVVGVVVNHYSNRLPLNLPGSALTGLPDFTIQLEPDIELHLDSLSGDLSNLLIVGTDNNKISISPVQVSMFTTFSISGCVTIDASNASPIGSNNFLGINLVGEVNLQFAALSQNNIAINLSGITYDSQIMANTVTIHVSQTATGVIHIGYGSSRGSLRVVASTLYSALLQLHTTAWIDQLRFVYTDTSGVQRYFDF